MQRFDIFLLIVAVVSISAGSHIVISEYQGSREAAALFSGESRHDFGVMDFTGEPLNRSHTFRLINTSGETLQITNTVSDCGCTVAAPTQRVLEPGEELVVPVEMKLVSPGARTSRITVVFAEGMTHDLRVSGIARAVVEASVSHQAILIPSIDDSQRIAISIISRDEKEPADPTLHAGAEIKITFLGWDRIYGPEDTPGGNTRWHGVVEATRLSKPPAEEDGAITITVGEETYTVRLGGRA